MAMSMKDILCQVDRTSVRDLPTVFGYFADRDNSDTVYWRLPLPENDLSVRPHSRGLEKLEKLANNHFRSAVRFSAGGGLRLGYHNHDFEFEHFSESTTILETFYGNTNRNVCAELDVHWVTRGGGNPETWIRKLKNRIPVIHFKDFTVYNRQPIFCEIGQGNLDWTGILKACREAEVKTFVVEQDLPFPGRDVFESAKLSFDFLTSIEW